ncbi:MAG: hypothetical protein ACFN4S_10100 [Prevotella conceptionensis]
MACIKGAKQHEVLNQTPPSNFSFQMVKMPINNVENGAFYGFRLHFAAFYLAFWCILQCVLVQNALQHQAHRLHFLVVVDANLGEISFKEKCKSIVNGQKWWG